LIKFTGYIDNRPTLGMGLSDENIRKLREGKPIVIHLSELDLPYDLQIFLFTGPTEQDMVDMLKEIGVSFSGVPVHEQKEPH
jgi:hypothetical protein